MIIEQHTIFNGVLLIKWQNLAYPVAWKAFQENSALKAHSNLFSNCIVKNKYIFF